jgi:hypothetical protein
MFVNNSDVIISLQLITEHVDDTGTWLSKARLPQIDKKNQVKLFCADGGLREIECLARIADPDPHYFQLLDPDKNVKIALKF